VQRLEGSGRLLFLVTPRVNYNAIAQFGPWAYRSNAAQYFNLLWPVCLGFWWTLQRFSGSWRKAHHLLILCGAVMAACPIVSTSRAGALVAVGMAAVAAVLAFVFIFFLDWLVGKGLAFRASTFAGVLLLLGLALGGGLALGWKSLKPRMEQFAEDFGFREEMYERALPMAADYPLFGTGPGTFEPVFQLYRDKTDTYWPAQLHNDWLETLITFGWVGSTLIMLAFLAMLARWFTAGGILGPRRFVMCIWLAMAGCLVQARVDFPFQMHSVVFLFLILGAVLTIVSRPRLATR
ncbi:MAG: O-antigen ligase family protein, partial [Verrucomicrobia bacterium]|nr:O-antigen ligase family protein [Verrucomicrobiota bacterium]